MTLNRVQLKCLSENSKNTQRISTFDDIPENRNKKIFYCTEAEKEVLSNQLEHRPVAENTDSKCSDDQSISIEDGKSPIKGNNYIAD